jgi:transcriptional regulator with XRE-family HTH domain
MKEKTETKQKQISDNAILLRKMRETKKITRKQAGILFNVSHKTIERLENGRGSISDEKLMVFANAYSFNLLDIQLMREGRYGDRLLPKTDRISNKDHNRKNRRFCQKKIQKECKVLRELREQKNLSQYNAGLLCGYNRATIGHIENGRINIPRDRIEHIVKTYGFTIEKFDELLLDNKILRHEMRDKCLDVIHNLEESKLQAVHGMLVGFSN